MERPPSLNDSKVNQSIRLVVIFHLVGFIGLSLPYTKPLFLLLVPFHLLLMAGILCANHQKLRVKFILFFVVMFVAGFVAEWVGVHTGILFGDYQYGDTLGFKIDGIPVLMGVNWFLLIYAAGTSLQHTPIKQTWKRVLAGAMALVLLDGLIEPTAINLNYWHWGAVAIPVTNYLCWFAISIMLLLGFELCHFKKQNMVGPVLLASQFIFFLALLVLSLF